MTAQAQQFNISDLTPEQVVAMAAAGLIEVNGTTAPQSSEAKPKPRAKRATPASEFGAYGTYPISNFDDLHPVIRRGARGVAGSIELKAKLNMLVVTGKCELSDTAYDALGKVMFKNGLAAKSTRRGGKVVSRFYAMNLTKAGVPNRSTTPFFTDGGRMRIDHATQEATLVPESGQEFAATQVSAIGVVVNDLS